TNLLSCDICRSLSLCDEVLGPVNAQVGESSTSRRPVDESALHAERRDSLNAALRLAEDLLDRSLAHDVLDTLILGAPSEVLAHGGEVMDVRPSQTIRLDLQEGQQLLGRGSSSKGVRHGPHREDHFLEDARSPPCGRSHVE